MPLMRTTKMTDAVKARVRMGDYASESEVIREGLRALMARERAVENDLANKTPMQPNTSIAVLWQEATTDPEFGFAIKAQGVRVAMGRAGGYRCNFRSATPAGQR